VSVSFEVAPGSQTIDFAALADVHLEASPLALEAQASSGLPVDYTTDGACSVADGELTLTATGACTVTAAQAGSDDWQPAPPVSRTFAITGPQEIDFATLADPTYGEAPLPLEASATSGLPVTFVADGACLVEDGRLTATSGGPCTVTASQAGDEAWDPAPDVSQELTVAPGVQTLGLEALADTLTGAPAQPVVAMATSGLPVTLTTDGPCTLEGSAVTPTGAGTCTVTASQAGDAAWAPADPVSVSFEVAGPITDEVSMMGEVATELPGTLVGDGAVVDSLLDVGRRPTEYYSVAVGIGDELTVTSASEGHEQYLSIAYPEALPQDAAGEDIEWVLLEKGTWLAPEAGLYTVRVSDASGGSGAYPYTVSFKIQPPAESHSLGAIATSLPGTLVTDGTTVMSILDPGHRPVEYFGIELAVGETLDVVLSSEGEAPRVRIAYPDALESGAPAGDVEWLDLGSAWLASEAGTYTIEVQDTTGGRPYRYSVVFEVGESGAP
jgi:hypothetical protein